MSQSQPPNEQPTIRVTAMPADANFYGDIFGGWLMGLMDLAAGSVASRRAQGRAATVAADAMNFHNPVRIGDEVSVYAAITSVGRSSMMISTEAWKRDRHGEQAVKVTEGNFTFVALDRYGKPRIVPEGANS
jgi:acyl-CoA thioesterase YciA